MTTAVIIPLFNGAQHIKAIHQALLAQDTADFVTYLVNDGSTDATAAELKQVASERIIPIQLPKNVGPSAARNIAIQKAFASGAEVILLLDIDCRVGKTWVRSHVEFLKENPQVGILGGAIQGDANTFIGMADGFASWFTAIPYEKSSEVRKLHLSTTNMSIRKNVFEKIGYFDEALATGEDVDFCRRAQQRNIKLWFQSDIIANHLDRNSLSAAKVHHYRWGLHSFTLGTRNHGGYYQFLKYLPPTVVRTLPIVVCVLNIIFVVARFIRKQPKILFYLPGIAYLKWANAKGVVDGYFNPKLCLRHTLISVNTD